MRSVLIVVVGLALAPSSHAAVPELSGAIVLEGRAHLVLVDPDTGTTSKWLDLGDDFAGYKIKDYHMESATVVLEHDGTEFSIALRKPVLLAPTPESIAIYFLPRGQIALDDTVVPFSDFREVLEKRGSIRGYDIRLVIPQDQDIEVVREVMRVLSKSTARSVRLENIPKQTVADAP